MCFLFCLGFFFFFEDTDCLLTFMFCFIACLSVRLLLIWTLLRKLSASLEDSLEAPHCVWTLEHGQGVWRPIPDLSQTPGVGSGSVDGESEARRAGQTLPLLFLFSNSSTIRRLLALPRRVAAISSPACRVACVSTSSLDESFVFLFVLFFCPSRAGMMKWTPAPPSPPPRPPSCLCGTRSSIK